jgi:hypothetical protein
MTLGNTASGKANKLNRAKAGQTISVVSGWSAVITKIANVEQLTKKGAVAHVIFDKADMAPIFLSVKSSWSFLTWRRRFMKGGSQA